MKSIVRGIAATAGLCTLAAPAMSEPVEVTVTPYLWTAGMEGDIAILPGLPPVHAESDFSDILDTLDFALASTIEVRRGRWAFLGDISYLKTSQGADLPPATSMFESASLESQSLAGTAAAAYRVVETADGSSIDLIGGARFNWAENDVRLTRPDDTEARGVNDESWFDPIVGVRAMTRLSPRWSLTGYADVGGFGVSSDLTWQALATADYRLNDRFSLVVGYRYYAIDYSDDGFVFDIAQHGPVIGAAIRS